MQRKNMKSIIKDIFIFILTVCILTSCDNKKDKSETKNSNIIGIWKAEYFIMGTLYGNIELPLKDSLTINNAYLCEDFVLIFTSDTTYVFKNTFGKPISGNYEYETDSLKLKINDNIFYDFRIDSLSKNEMYLSRNAYTWAFFVDNNTIDIHTGSNIKTILRKQDK
jgi:hypothetical protein